MSLTDTRFEEVLRSFVKTGRRPHTPRFRVLREKAGWRIFDGERAIAKLYPDFADIWSFSPFEPDVIHNPAAPEPILDIHTVHNTCVNLGSSEWPAAWRADGRAVRLKWTKRAGSQLEALLTKNAPDGERCDWRLRVSYDPAWRRYRYVWEVHARKHDPEGMEGFNMMLAGALASRPEERRWTHSVWPGPDGTLRRLVHSNALLMCTDYGWGLIGAEKRTRNTAWHGAWIAYAANEKFNPAVLIHETTVPLRYHTCAQLFDEHVQWAKAGMENVEEDGLFHFRMRVELVNIGARLARRLLAAAVDPVRHRVPRNEFIALPFHMDRVNSFERALDPWKPEECPILIVPAGPKEPIRWASDGARAGSRSIRIECTHAGERRELFPFGAVCNVKPRSRYRLTGWIKTARADRFARLELHAYEYSYVNILASANSSPVSGTRGWTRVSVELDSGEERYLMPKFVLFGAGVAWFSDVSLVEV